MPLSSVLRTVRHPAAIALRLLLWPALILVLSDLASRSEDDALAGGLMTFVGIVVASFVLALADGLVLRTRPLALVWSVTTVVVAGLVAANPMVDYLLHGPEGTTTWAYTVQSTLQDLPLAMAFLLVLVGVPVAMGAVTGAAVRYGVDLSRGGASRPPRDQDVVADPAVR